MSNIKSYECIDCDTYITTSGARMIEFVDEDGNQVGCPTCGSLRFRRVFKQVIKEEKDEWNTFV